MTWARKTHGGVSHGAEEGGTWAAASSGRKFRCVALLCCTIMHAQWVADCAAYAILTSVSKTHWSVQRVPLPGVAPRRRRRQAAEHPSRCAVPAAVRAGPVMTPRSCQTQARDATARGSCGWTVEVLMVRFNSGCISMSCMAGSFLITSRAGSKLASPARGPQVGCKSQLGSGSRHNTKRHQTRACCWGWHSAANRRIALL